MLEVYLERQLDLASGIPGIRYLAELRRPQRRAGIAETGMVHRVEELRAQLEVPAFEERPAFVHREIQVIQAIGAQDVAAGIAERVLRRLGEGSGVKPELREGWAMAWGSPTMLDTG